MRFFFLLFLIFTIVSSLAELEVDGDDVSFFCLFLLLNLNFTFQLVLKMDSNDEIKVRRARSEDAVKVKTLYSCNFDMAT